MADSVANKHFGSLNNEGVHTVPLLDLNQKLLMRFC